MNAADHQQMKREDVLVSDGLKAGDRVRWTLGQPQCGTVVEALPEGMVRVRWPSSGVVGFHQAAALEVVE